VREFPRKSSTIATVISLSTENLGILASQIAAEMGVNCTQAGLGGGLHQ
jgi:hypothetical protein